MMSSALAAALRFSGQPGRRRRDRGDGAVSAFGEGIQLAAKGERYRIVGLWSAPGTVPVEPWYLNNRNTRIIGTALFEGRHVHGAIQVARRFHRLPTA